MRRPGRPVAVLADVAVAADVEVAAWAAAGGAARAVVPAVAPAAAASRRRREVLAARWDTDDLVVIVLPFHRFTGVRGMGREVGIEPNPTIRWPNRRLPNEG